MKRGLRRATIAVAFVLGLALLAAAIPIAHVELSCRAPPGAAEAPAPSEIDAGHRRAVGDSFMTYPEWYIVHAYADLAGVTRRSSESRFDYATSIGTFWSSLCGATRTAGTVGPVTTDQRITDYVIGLSFSLEMAVQGGYERSVGAVTVWTRGDERTAEDAFNQRWRGCGKLRRTRREQNKASNVDPAAQIFKGENGLAVLVPLREASYG